MPLVRTLLAGLLDYAGLFPPARQTLAEAVREFAAHSVSPRTWALGRFVVPAGRVVELVAARRAFEPGGNPWRTALVCGPDVHADLERLARGAPAAEIDAEVIRVESVEFAVRPGEDLAALLGRVPRGLERFVEVPFPALPDLVPRLRALGAWAKLRTGGIVEDAIPSVSVLARALAVVVSADAPFKCTAGLHHPVRGLYRLTYDPDATVAMMHGYLNVLVTTLALRGGHGSAVAEQILSEEDPHAFWLGDDFLAWRALRFTSRDISDLRRAGFRSLGTCSFQEPMDELHAMRMT